MAKRKASRRREVDVPPDDALGIQSWAYRLVAQQLQDVANDRSLPDAKRRELVLRHAQTLVPLIPKSALHEAANAVQGERDDLQSTRRGPELEDAPQFDRTRSAPAAKRGRPRKRSSL